MANKTKLSEWITWPARVLAAFIAIGVMLAAFGFRVDTPGDQWEDHDVQHVEEMEVHQEEFTKIDVALEKFDDMQMTQQVLVEAIVRGECIENPIENLQRQGLIAKCEELGIER